MCNGYIILKEERTNIPVEEKQISHFKAGGNYTFVHFLNGTFRKQCGNLKEWEENPDVMEMGCFIRAHDSYMLNWKNVLEYDRWQATMNDKDKTKILLSADGYDELHRRFTAPGFRFSSNNLTTEENSMPDNDEEE